MWMGVELVKFGLRFMMFADDMCVVELLNKYGSGRRNSHTHTHPSTDRISVGLTTLAIAVRRQSAPVDSHSSHAPSVKRP